MLTPPSRGRCFSYSSLFTSFSTDAHASVTRPIPLLISLFTSFSTDAIASVTRPTPLLLLALYIVLHWCSVTRPIPLTLYSSHRSPLTLTPPSRGRHLSYSLLLTPFLYTDAVAPPSRGRCFSYSSLFTSFSTDGAPPSRGRCLSYSLLSPHRSPLILMPPSRGRYLS